MNTFRQSFVCFFLCMQSVVLYSQDSDDISYARQVVDTLASPSMHGRGYVMNGHVVAADFISKEFSKLKLRSFNKAGTFYQYFNFPVNTFPKNAMVRWQRASGEGDPVAGVDYMIGSASPSLKGKFEVDVLDSSVVADSARLALFLKKDLRKKFLIVDTLGVHDKQQLLFLQNYIRYPNRVKGLIIPVNYGHVGEMGHECTRLNPWDFSQVQSRIVTIEIARNGQHHLSIKSIEVNIDAKFIKQQKSQNVIGYIPGTACPDSFIVFTAHYDHLGHMGRDVFFPGANDNASGVAMLLDLAKYYSDSTHRLRCSVAFMAFGAEEVWLIGSHYYTQHPLFPLKQIRFLVNMDIFGTGDEGVTVVNGTLFSKQFKLLEKINAQHNLIPQIKMRGKASISDHYFFTEKDVPCFYIYTLGGIKAYHDVCDKASTLPLTKFAALRKMLEQFASGVDKK